MVIRTALGIATGTIASSTNALAIKMIENVLKKGDITIQDIAEIISDNPKLVNDLWEWLIINNYIKVKEEKGD